MIQASAFVVRYPAHWPCEAGTLVNSPFVILKVESFTRSQRRGDVFGDRFSGLNSLATSRASEAIFGFTRPVRYLKAILDCRADFPVCLPAPIRAESLRASTTLIRQDLAAVLTLKIFDGVYHSSSDCRRGRRSLLECQGAVAVIG